MNKTSQKRITLYNRTIHYAVRKSRRAKNVSVTVYPGARIVGTIPHYVTERVLEQFMHHNAQWIVKKVQEFERAGSPLPSSGTRREYEQYKEVARQKIHHALERLNQEYGFTYRRVSIRNQKTRWGSCSSNKNLSFNYQIIFLPPKLMEYILVHELCHLAQLNHSKKFWQLVERSIPDYRTVRAQLKSIYLG